MFATRNANATQPEIEEELLLRSDRREEWAVLATCKTHISVDPRVLCLSSKTWSLVGQFFSILFGVCISCAC